MKLSILAGSTSQSVNLFIQDSSSTTGAGLTGLAYNSSGLTAYYSFAGANATATAITLATLAAVNSAYSSGGFKEIDSTNMPGWYRFDIPNAALATSKGRSVGIHFKGATNMAPLPIEIELTGWDNQDAVRGGMTALPNANAAASGGLIINGSNTGTVTLAALTCTGTFTISDGLVIARSTSNQSAISATGNGTGSGMALTSGSGATGNGLTLLAASTNGHGFKSTGAGTGDGMELTAGASGVDLDADMTGNITGNLSGTVGNLAAGAKTDVAVAVWDAVAATYNTASSMGALLHSAASAGDPWSTALPGAYGAGTAGYIVGTNLDATVSSRLASASYTTPPTAAQNATAVWQDATAGDFTVASSIGKALYINDVAPGASGGHMIAGANAGTITFGAFTITGAMSINGTGNVSQTGDSFARLGAPVGVSISADIAAVQSDTNDIQTRLPAALVGGRMDSNMQAAANNVITSSVLATDCMTAAQIDSTFSNEIADALLGRTNGIETGITPKQAWRAMASASGGVLAGAATATVTLNELGGTSFTRIQASVDANGNRTAVTLSL